jgi:hypothetical protein
MPWINLTLRRGALPKPIQHAVMAKLTEVLMWWEKVPNTPTARKVIREGLGLRGGRRRRLQRRQSGP